MGKNKQSLIEEINRIKSLFSEERLWGNLTESTDDECMDQLEASGYIVSKPGSTENNVVRNMLIDCLYVGGDRTKQTNLHKIYEKIKAESTNVKIEIIEKGSGCMLLFQNKTKCNISDQIYASLWRDNNFTWNIQVLYKLLDPIVTSGLAELTGVGVYYLGWEGILNEVDMNYAALQFTGVYKKGAIHIPGTKSLNIKQLKQYMGKGEVDAAGDGVEDTTGLNTTHPKYGEFLLGQTGIKKSGNFITDILNNSTGFCVGGAASWVRKI